MSEHCPECKHNEEFTCAYQRDVWDAAVSIAAGMATKIRHIEAEGKLRFHEDDVLDLASMAHTMATRLMQEHFEWLATGVDPLNASKDT